MDNIKKIFDNPIARNAVMGLGIFIVVVLIIVLIASCSGGKNYTFEELEAKMVSSAKKYYESSNSNLPKNDKDKVELSLQTLIDNGYVGETSKITKEKASCTGKVTVVNNNGYYLYSPFLDCGSAYKTKYLVDVIKDEANVVTTGNGLYKDGSSYIYKGDNVNNILILNEVKYMIMSIDENDNIRVIDTTKRQSVSWDDRYNVDRKGSMGINDYVANNINSRIKDTIEDIYKNDEVYPTEIKAYFTTHSVCVDKVSFEEIKNSSTCTNYLDNQVFSLLTANDFYKTSLDENCGTNNKACVNYNYLSSLGNSWTITADKDTSYRVYKISSGDLELKNASGMATYKMVAYLDKNVLYASGEGTEENPYVVKTYLDTKK